MASNSSGTSSGILLDPIALQNLDRRIQRDIDEGRNFGASIIVARGGTIGHQRTFGTVAPGRDASANDLYLAMSLSKSFTAALVLRAVDQGRLTLDTKAASIIPAFAAGGKQRVTVRHLLTHTAGTYAGLLPPPPIPPQEMGDLAKNVHRRFRLFLRQTDRASAWSIIPSQVTPFLLKCWSRSTRKGAHSDR
jgi:CubicO group peptidase (beta-lactamase class C family)